MQTSYKQGLTLCCRLWCGQSLNLQIQMFLEQNTNDIVSVASPKIACALRQFCTKGPCSFAVAIRLPPNWQLLRTNDGRNYFWLESYGVGDCSIVPLLGQSHGLPPFHRKRYQLVHDEHHLGIRRPTRQPGVSHRRTVEVKGCFNFSLFFSLPTRLLGRLGISRAAKEHSVFKV